MEEPPKTNTAAFGVTALGLTIARKQLEGDDLLEKQQTKKTQQRKQKQKQMVTTTSWTKKKTVDGKQKNASWLALVEGVTLYGTCLVLPSLIGMILRWDSRQVVWEQLQVEICERSAWICWHAFGAVLPPEPDVPEPLTFAKNFAPDTYLSDIYVVLLMTFTMALFRVLLVHMLVPNNLAPRQMEALVRCKSIHLLSSDYKQSLTPRPEMPRNVLTWDSLNKELVSVSRDQLPSLPLFPEVARPGEEGLGYETLEPVRYPLVDEVDSGSHQVGPRSAFRRPSGNDLGLSIDTPIQDRRTFTMDSAQIGGFLQSCAPLDGLDDKINQNLMVDDSENDYWPRSPIMTPQAPTLSTPTHSPVPFLERPQSPQPSEVDDESREGLGWKRRGSTASLAAAAAAAVQEEEDDEDDHPHNVAKQENQDAFAGARPQRLFAAPRYATAVFRLLYCTVSGAMAWYLFKDADFWPSYVGGHGNTAHCWDLSGSLSLAKSLDSDFDHRNTVLRRFFLVQASYHLHSGAFHVFSVLLLHFLKKDDSEADATSDSPSKKGWVSLLASLFSPRAMAQHSLSLIFLSVSYVFSSLRRLGAIGMFAFDMSSWALHLLQTCLNAPTDSILRKPKVIKGVWGLVVLPSFLYFRGLVWPMLGYSSMVESEQWLAQLESTLVPGSALWFRRIFLLWMTLWMGFHAVRFKRLVFHPHIQRIMGTAGEYASVTEQGNLNA